MSYKSTDDQSIEIAFRMRKMRKFELDKVLITVKSGCEKIRMHTRFENADETLEFIRGYAFVRDIALAAKYAGQVQEYNIPVEQFKQCVEIVRFIEKARSDTQVKSGNHLFHEIKEAPFGRSELMMLFTLFAPLNNQRSVNPKND